MPQSMTFTKMHGLGNDFVVIDTLHNSITPNDFPISFLSNRHLGIGFDQLLVIGPSTVADFSCRIFNADGSEAEQCGNGMRCVARFLHEQKLWPKDIVHIETKAGIIQATVLSYDQIKITMGIPSFETSFEMLLGSSLSKITVLSMGNPHAILQVSSIQHCPIDEWSTLLSNLPIFNAGINIGFMEIINRGHIRLRTYERGVGETLACGSNACAAVATGIANNLLGAHVNVELSLGNLTIEWETQEKPITMTGPASRVFSGVVSIR